MIVQWHMHVCVREVGLVLAQPGVALEDNVTAFSLQHQTLSICKVHCQAVVDQATPPGGLAADSETHHGTGHLTMYLEHQLQCSWAWGEGEGEREGERVTA